MEGNLVLEKNFRDNGIGYGLQINKTLVEKCIQECSNEPFWASWLEVGHGDLRNPAYEKEWNYVMKQMEYKF